MEPHQNTRSGALLRSLAAIVIITAVIGETSALAKFASSQHAEIKFVATQMDVAVNGEFKKFPAEVDFDPAKPALSKVNVVTDVATVDTGSSDANELLKGKDFLDAMHFPHATFTSTSITAAVAGKFLANAINSKGQEPSSDHSFYGTPRGCRHVVRRQHSALSPSL